METAHVIYHTEADKNGHHFADDMLKLFFKYLCILIQIAVTMVYNYLAMPKHLLWAPKSSYMHKIGANGNKALNISNHWGLLVHSW